jgi:hypothetical protein
MADDSAKKMEEAKSCLEKIERTKKCLAVLTMLRQHVAELKALSMDGLERQYAESSFVHTERIQNCLNNLFFRLQETIGGKDQGHKTSRKNSRSIKP